MQGMNGFLQLPEHPSDESLYQKLTAGTIIFNFRSIIHHTFDAFVLGVHFDANFLVDVFLTDASYHIHNLPCTVVYNVEVGAPVCDNQSAGLPTMRRCAVRFTGRSDEHKRQVRSFIRTHTVGEAEDSFTP